MAPRQEDISSYPRAFPYLTSFLIQARTRQDRSWVNSFTTTMRSYVKLRRTIWPVGAICCLPSCWIEPESRLKREDFESGLSRWGSEDLIFWILLLAFHGATHSRRGSQYSGPGDASRPPFGLMMRQLRHPHKLEAVGPESCPAEPCVVVAASIAGSSILS